MKTISRTEIYHSNPTKVFDTIDDLGVTGMHMTESSTMMMGSKLHLKYLTENHTGLGSKYQWTGRTLGMAMDFTVEVKKWDRGVEKIWETIGQSKMIIYSWFQMHLLVRPLGNNTEAFLSITYERPKNWFAKFLSFLFSDFYCNWCLENMLTDARKIVELNFSSKTNFMELRTSKFGAALGVAFAIGFLLCNLVFLIGGENFSLSVMNMIFHKTDFKPLMTHESFSFGKLLGGMAILFIAGTIVGSLTASIYNSNLKSKVS